MNGRHWISWGSGWLVILAGTFTGCNSAVPLAETPPPPVTVSRPVSREVIDNDDYDGRVDAIQKVEVRARVRGHLTKVGFQDGQIVKPGDLLFEIDPRPYKADLDGAEAQKAIAEARVELAKKTYARTVALQRTGAASVEDVDVDKAKRLASEADRAKAIADVEQAKLNLGFTKVIAETAGKISRTQVTVGNLVNAGGGETLLTTIMSVDPMYVYFDVDERALLRYRRDFRKGKTDSAGKPLPIKELKIPIEVGLEGEEGYPHKGVIDFADNRVNPSTGAILVRGIVDNPKRLLEAGMRARVRVPIGDPHKALMVTERAVGNDQGRKFLYVVNAENVVERRDVTLGPVIDDLQVIPAGLKADDWVIVNGIQRARDGMKVDPKRSPMPGADVVAGAQDGTTGQGAGNK